MQITIFLQDKKRDKSRWKMAVEAAEFHHVLIEAEEDEGGPQNIYFGNWRLQTTVCLSFSSLTPNPPSSGWCPITKMDHSTSLETQNPHCWCALRRRRTMRSFMGCVSRPTQTWASLRPHTPGLQPKQHSRAHLPQWRQNTTQAESHDLQCNSRSL